MDLEARIIAFTRLGAILREAQDPLLKEAMATASKHNGWFTEENVRLTVTSLGEMLREEKIRKWISKYKVQSTKPEAAARKIGIIMAGNIPLVGFHDFLCVLISGNVLVGKLSSDDDILLPALTKILTELEPGFKDKVNFTDQKLGKANLSAFIGTGSNNSARYFEYYFGKYPHIIRKNRNSVAILDGDETEADLKELGKDIFQYFGMGCRNVSKIYIPEDYNLDNFFSGIVDFGDVINHNKYYNNHQYYRTIYLLNSEKFLDNNFLMLKESEQIASPVATLYYERYKNKEELFKKLDTRKNDIQCIVSSPKSPAPSLQSVAFGQAQSPELWDYADGIDTMKFLLDLM